MPEFETIISSTQSESQRKNQEPITGDVLGSQDTLEREDSSDEVKRFELNGLNDNEYLNLSQTFGNEYVGLLSGQNKSERQKLAAEKVIRETAPIIEKIKHLDDRSLAKYMIEGYRRSLNKLYKYHRKEVPFEDTTVSDDDLKHIVRIDRGPYGIPVIFTDGYNKELFGDDTLSFAATEIMLENGLPPAVIVYEGYSTVEKEQVTTHEISHAVFTLLRRAGIIPNPQGEGITQAGKKSAFELARDEAIAQLAANQNGTGHPSVIQRMKSESYPEDALEEYRDATNAFNKPIAEKAGLTFSDAILGVVMAKNFGEFNSHMLRMSKLAKNLKPIGGASDILPSSPSSSSNKSEWGSA